MLALGLQSKDRKSTKVKANINNPKVNKGFPPLTANHISADKFHLDPQWYDGDDDHDDIIMIVIVIVCHRDS